MDRIYKIGGHCFALPDERLMEAVDGISGFKPFSWQPDLVSAKDVYEGAWLPDFTVWEGNGWDFPAFKRKSYGFGYEDVTGTFGVGGDRFCWNWLRRENRRFISGRWVEPGEVSVYMVIILPVF